MNSFGRKYAPSRRYPRNHRPAEDRPFSCRRPQPPFGPEAVERLFVSGRRSVALCRVWICGRCHGRCIENLQLALPAQSGRIEAERREMTAPGQSPTYPSLLSGPSSCAPILPRSTRPVRIRWAGIDLYAAVLFASAPTGPKIRKFHPGSAAPAYIGRFARSLKADPVETLRSIPGHLESSVRCHRRVSGGGGFRSCLPRAPRPSVAVCRTRTFPCRLGGHRKGARRARTRRRSLDLRAIQRR